MLNLLQLFQKQEVLEFLNHMQDKIPFRNDFEKAERMRQEIIKVKELTSKPFGVNLFHSEQNPDMQLQLLLNVVYEEKVPVAVIYHDNPDIAEDIIKDLKAHGVTVVYRHLNFNPDFTRKAEKAGADYCCNRNR